MSSTAHEKLNKWAGPLTALVMLLVGVNIYRNEQSANQHQKDNKALALANQRLTEELDRQNKCFNDYNTARDEAAQARTLLSEREDKNTRTLILAVARMVQQPDADERAQDLRMMKLFKRYETREAHIEKARKNTPLPVYPNCREKEK